MDEISMLPFVAASLRRDLSIIELAALCVIAKEGPASAELASSSIANLLARPFTNGEAHGCVERLIERGWVERDDNRQLCAVQGAYGPLKEGVGVVVRLLFYLRRPREDSNQLSFIDDYLGGKSCAN